MPLLLMAHACSHLVFSNTRWAATVDFFTTKSPAASNSEPRNSDNQVAGQLARAWRHGLSEFSNDRKRDQEPSRPPLPEPRRRDRDPVEDKQRDAQSEAHAAAHASALEAFERDPKQTLNAEQRLWAETHEPARLHAAVAKAQQAQASAKDAESAKRHQQPTNNGPKAVAIATSIRGASGGLQSIVAEFQRARAEGKVPEAAIGTLGKVVLDSLRTALVPVCGGPEAGRALAVLCELSKPDTAESLIERVRQLADQFQGTVLSKANAAGEALGVAPDAGQLAAVAEQAARAAISKALAKHAQGEKVAAEIHLGVAYDQLAPQLAKLPALASQPEPAAYILAAKARLFREDGVLRPEVLVADERARAALSVFEHEPRSSWHPFRGRVLEAFGALIEKDVQTHQKGKEPDKKERAKGRDPTESSASMAAKELPAFPQGKLRPGDDLPVDVGTWTRIIGNLPRADGPCVIGGIPVKAGGVVVKREASLVWLSGGRMIGWMPIEDLPAGGTRSGEYWIWNDGHEVQVGKRYAQDAAAVKKEAPKEMAGRDLERREEAGAELNRDVETFMSQGHSLRQSIQLARHAHADVLVQMIQGCFTLFGVWAVIPGAMADVEALGEAIGRKLGQSGKSKGPPGGKAKKAEAKPGHNGDDGHEDHHEGTDGQKHDGERPIHLPGNAETLILGGNQAHWPEQVANFLARELRLEPGKLTVKMLKEGRSGDPVFAIQMDGKDLGVLKVFANAADTANEIKMIHTLKQKHLKEYNVVDEKGSAQAKGADGADKGALLMETAGGESVGRALKSVPPPGPQRAEAISALESGVKRVARAMAEMHAAFATGDSMSQGAKQNIAKYNLSKLASLKGRIPDADIKAIQDKLTSEVIPAFVRSPVPETAYHGDANVGNFMVDKDRNVRVIDVGSMKWSLDKHGNGTSTGAADVGRFMQSIEASASGKLEASEVARVQGAFQDEYFKASKLSREDFEPGVRLFRADLEVAAMRSPDSSPDEVKAAHGRIAKLLGISATTTEEKPSGVPKLR